MSASELAGVLEADILGNPGTVVTGAVETDSRLISSGGMFFAKPGDQFDGHDFVTDAKKKGAVLAVVQHPVDVDITQLVVRDSVFALGQLAKWLVLTLKSKRMIKVIGITGSNGKTTTKNMLREMLSKVGNTIAPIDSFNNKVGAPISILRADFETEFLLVEMGAGGLGSISYLADIAKPDVAVILKVGMAHAGEFGGIESTAKIKGELVEALSEDGKLVLNADDSRVSAMRSKTKAEVHFFGTSADLEYSASEVALSRSGTSFTLKWPDGEITKIQLQILGEHHIMNALAAATVASLLGATKTQIVDSLEGMELAERWRMERQIRPDGVTVINDAYNASPESMKAALQTLAQIGKLGSRTIAVLGEMAELGEYSIHEHDSIGRLAVRLNINQLVVVGEGAKLIHMGASQEGSWNGESEFFSSCAQALEHLHEIIKEGDTVLVKSSKSANLRFLGDQLMEKTK